MSEGAVVQDLGFVKPPCGSQAKFTLEGEVVAAANSIFRGRRVGLTLSCMRAQGHDGAHQAAAGSIAFEWHG